MEAKKLTMAVSFMMVLAAAFVLVVPSESDAAEEFEITNAYFQDYPTNVAVKVFFNQQATDGGSFELYYGDELVKALEIRPGQSQIQTKLGASIQEGTYTVYIATPNGSDSIDIAYPTPVQNEIKINKTIGGTITADKSVAFPGEEVKLTVVADDNYRLVGLDMNGDEVDLETLTFVMPNKKASVTGEFEQIIVNYKVTFMVSSMKYDEQEVLKGTTVTAPAEPTVKGVEFAGWCTADDEPFDLSTPITQDTVLYASYAAESPSTEQTTKFVANIAVDGGVCNLVTTAYDGKIIGKGTAAIGVYMMYGGNFVYIDAVKYAIDGKDVFSVDNITKEIKTIATEPGQYAVMSTVMLDSGASYITNFALFEIEAQA